MDWLAVLTGLGGLLIGGLVRPKVDLAIARRQTRQQAKAAADDAATKHEANVVAAEANADARVAAVAERHNSWLKQALDLSLTGEETKLQRAWALYKAVAGDPEVSPDNARMCRVLRVQLAGELGGPYVAQLEAAGEDLVPYVDSDPGQGDHGSPGDDPGQTGNAPGGS